MDGTALSPDDLARTIVTAFNPLLVLLAVITAAGFVVASVGAGSVAFGLVWVLATYIGAGIGVGIFLFVRRLS